MQVSSIDGQDASTAPSGETQDHQVSVESRPGRDPWIVHPFLVGMFPILSLYAHNVFELPLLVLALPLALTLISTAALWLALRFWTRDTMRSAVAATLLVALFFGYESFRSTFEWTWFNLNQYWVERPTHVDPMFVMAVELLLASAGYLAIFYRIRQPSRWTLSLNVFTSILVALPTVGLIASRASVAWEHRRQSSLPALQGKGATPDIYYILLDGYARADVMKEIYGYDNRPFLDGLERKGFFVARRSTSNYCQTMLSLASILNADYLDKLVDLDSRDLLQVGERIKDSQVLRVLRSRGYKTVAFASGFEATEMTEAETYLAPGPGTSAFNELLIEMTPLAAIFAEVRWIDRFWKNRTRTQFVLDRLPSIARIPGPTFTFAHIVSPHPPFVFGENGEDVSPRVFGPNNQIHRLDPFIGTPEYVRQGYRNQAKFITRRVERTIQRILELSPEPPVIILQSDHGAWLHYHPNDAEATDVRERFGTLNAVLMPGRKKIEGLTDDISSVNTFRIVFNNLFGTNLPLLERRAYFSTVQEPLQMIDVTERLSSEKERTRTFKAPKSYLGILQQF